VLLLERLVEAFNRAVGLGGVVAGANVFEVRLATDEPREGVVLEGSAVVGDDARAPDLTGLAAAAVAEELVAEKVLGVGDGAPEHLDRIAALGVARTCTESTSLVAWSMTQQVRREPPTAA